MTSLVNFGAMGHLPIRQLSLSPVTLRSVSEDLRMRGFDLHCRKPINIDDLRKILKHTRSASPDAQLAEAGL